jgi:hypothetical protein
MSFRLSVGSGLKIGGSGSLVGYAWRGLHLNLHLVTAACNIVDYSTERRRQWYTIVVQCSSEVCAQVRLFLLVQIDGVGRCQTQD